MALQSNDSAVMGRSVGLAPRREQHAAAAARAPLDGGGCVDDACPDAVIGAKLLTNTIVARQTATLARTRRLTVLMLRQNIYSGQAAPLLPL